LISKKGAWSEWDHIKISWNAKPFSGISKDWEEFSEKFRLQMAAAHAFTASVLDIVYVFGFLVRSCGRWDVLQAKTLQEAIIAVEWPLVPVCSS